MENFRKIIHVDMDAFFASVEQRDFPEYRNKPLAVGSPHPRGVIAAASYEARKYGVRSAMSSERAKRLCPHLIFTPHRMSVYKAVSQEIHNIFREYTDLIEPLSLDEAFLDVTKNKKNIVLAQDIAHEIKQKIQTELKLTASAGVSYNKFLAKVASDIDKPNGLTVIHPNKALDIIARLPIERFWGVGKVTAKKMHQNGIHTGKDVQGKSEQELILHFGKLGSLLAKFANGDDPRCVEPFRKRKSVGCEQTYSVDIFKKEDVFDKIVEVAEELEKRVERANFEGQTFTLKLKQDDFRILTRSITNNKVLKSSITFVHLAKQLYTDVDLRGHSIRLIGLSVRNPINESWKSAIETNELQLELPFVGW